jgi:hypothetical protein
MCTVHAPHCAMPHPYFVPVNPTTSLIAQSSGIFGSTSTVWVLPLILSVSEAISVWFIVRYKFVVKLDRVLAIRRSRFFEFDIFVYERYPAFTIDTL